MSRRSYAKLTPREAQRIVALRAEGLTFDVIVARIGCSKGAVWNVLHAHKFAANRKANAAANERTQKCVGAIAAVQALLKKTGGGRP